MGNCVQHSPTDKIVKFLFTVGNIVTVVNLVIFLIKINIPFIAKCAVGADEVIGGGNCPATYRLPVKLVLSVIVDDLLTCFHCCSLSSFVSLVAMSVNEAKIPKCTCLNDLWLIHMEANLVNHGLWVRWFTRGALMVR